MCTRAKIHTRRALFHNGRNLRSRKSNLAGRDPGKVEPRLSLHLTGLSATPMGKSRNDVESVCRVCANVVPGARSRRGT